MIHNNSYLRVYYNLSDVLSTAPYWTYHIFPKDWFWVNQDESNKTHFHYVELFCGPTHSVQAMRNYLEGHYKTLLIGKVVSAFIVE